MKTLARQGLLEWSSHFFSPTILSCLPTHSLFPSPEILCALLPQLCPTPGSSTDCSPSGSSIHGILQARILEWVAISLSRGSSWPSHWTQVSCITGRFFTVWATREATIYFSSLSQMLLSFSLIGSTLKIIPRGTLSSQIGPLYYQGSKGFYFISSLG